MRPLPVAGPPTLPVDPPRRPYLVSPTGSSSEHRLTAGDGDVRAGHVAVLVRGEQHERRRYLARLSPPSPRSDGHVDSEPPPTVVCVTTTRTARHRTV
jgi:hypothetical protein